jgi:hypothetical protein
METIKNPTANESEKNAANPLNIGNSSNETNANNDDSQFKRALKYITVPLDDYEKKMFKVLLGISFVGLIGYLIPMELLLKILYKIIVIIMFGFIMFMSWLYFHVEPNHRNEFMNRFVDVYKLTINKFQTDFTSFFKDESLVQPKNEIYEFKF